MRAITLTITGFIIFQNACIATHSVRCRSWKRNKSHFTFDNCLWNKRRLLQTLMCGLHIQAKGANWIQPKENVKKKWIQPLFLFSPRLSISNRRSQKKFHSLLLNGVFFSHPILVNFESVKDFSFSVPKAP